MNRLAFFLLVALMLCALSLVGAQHQARTLFVALERAQSEEKQLDVDWSRLQYQQSALSKSARIADAARSQLQMSPVTPGRTQYLSGIVLAPASGVAAAPASSAEGRP
ncbi:cell division protein FtsL [Cupriavidus sp. USMAA2-4]|uniref:Cell division protein FtsL n=1 Tax=Cupriavidus malaysiensis TaxID=367825 RepID=A0ABN4TPR9_9BURK|nr:MULTISPECIES: cell division protein FtsL [Cupriavidus]AOY92662.1 cell division protein FtsL [Cupriavidus sp. USMAA2-4]AOZ00865.1 cell division protein FtsL [Cupriavidus sp. USMAHM13]AOZ07625.1 cell division protein FtsL [Cupriavidus malaysiensis]